MLAVMFLDIDHFKRINDSLGHDAGDELLKVIANHIKAATRQDLVARLGGDEFCVVTSLNSRDEARHLAQRIMQRMKEPIDLGGRRMVMTTSIGISIFRTTAAAPKNCSSMPTWRFTSPRTTGATA
jgi:diguanylate cyclase (GGDEF)-like protein